MFKVLNLPSAAVSVLSAPPAADRYTVLSPRPTCATTHH